jgi:hypothetical protein
MDAFTGLLAQHDMDELEAMTPEQLAEELRREGIDPDRVQADIAAARAAAYGDAIAVERAASAAPPPTPAPARVVSLDAARERRVPARRLVPLLAAAAMLLLFAGGGVQMVAELPKPKLDYPTYVPPPTPAERAAPLRMQAERLCKMGYYGECRDALDAATAIDPAGERDPAVANERREIEGDVNGGTPGISPRVNTKPGLAPWERPLKKTP